MENYPVCIVLIRSCINFPYKHKVSDIFHRLKHAQENILCIFLFADSWLNNYEAFRHTPEENSGEE